MGEQPAGAVAGVGQPVDARVELADEALERGLSGFGACALVIGHVPSLGATAIAGNTYDMQCTLHARGIAHCFQPVHSCPQPSGSRSTSAADTPA
jgi:hypothetical protein